VAGEDTLEFRILGPFEVSERGQPLEVGSGKQRALLALLLLNFGEVVSTDRLIDGLWAERAPASAPNSVHIYVSRLRRALGNGLLETRGHGYVLALDSEQLDLTRFERLLDEGREFLADDGAAPAAETLRAALALWRGPPLADFGSEPFAQDEIARLEELHVNALEERIEADLALGRHAALVPELEALVREHPLRERLCAQLMVALYRSGRQAEALEAYQQARRMLREELGLEPGRNLQELERAILNHDPELDLPKRTPSVRERAPRRGGALIAIGAAVLLSAAVAIAAIELTGGDGPGLAAASANSVAALDTRSNRIVADVPVGNGPTSVAVGEGSVWVTNALDRSVSRIDPDSGAVLQRIDVGGDPSGIAVGAGAVWVANSLDGTVSRIDPQTNREVQAIPVGVTPTALAVGDGVVWVTSAEERNVARIDVARGRVVGDRIATGALGHGIAVGAGSVWVTDGSSRSVVRIDSRRGSVVDGVSVGNGPTGIAFDDGSVWVANSLDGTVMRIDPGTSRVTATIPVGEGPDGIAVGSDAVWVSGEFSEKIARIDPAENRVVERIPIANRPKGLALHENRLWIAVQASGAGHRGGRLVVGGDLEGSIDPSFMSWAGTISALSTAYDGLVGPARRGGSEGGQIVPNLARSLPVITAGGTTYAFQLRRGIRYSNGTLVKASDFRRAFERRFHGDFPPTIPLLGADACKRRPRSCDLGRGIRTDDATGTIVFHLRRPDAQFLRWWAWTPPIPRGTPDRDTGTRPVPSTGPYMIESYAPERALTLVRNPYFHVWSRAARPDGFPDEIEFRMGLRNGVAAVERGRADVTFMSNEQPEYIKAFEDFRARFASRVHLEPVQATVLLFLNTTQSPFDDVRVRRAVNYAVDRAAIAGSYGVSQPTCQLRPPGTVGFRRYCPYTAAASKVGEWKAPDLARARRLVAASGTQGMSVVVWTYPGFWERAAEASVRALRQLGYRAKIRRAEDYDDYIATASDGTTRRVQAGMVGWYGVPRAASSLLDLFRCSPPDLSFFCDRRIDARIARALEIEATDPDAAVALWTGIEHDIVDLAPWAPLFTPVHASVVSARVGNYQRNPEVGLLLDQLWVR
jgi:YVTN family beta-propeller protein